MKRCLLDAVAGPPEAVAGAGEGVGVVKEVPERTASLHAQTVKLVCAELPASSRDGEI